MGSADFLSQSGLFNEYGISVVRKNDDSFWPLHWHDCWELEIVTDGSGTQILNGKSFALSRGSVYLLSPTDFHEVRCHGLSLYTVCFCDEKIPASLIGTLTDGKTARFCRCGEAEFQPLLQITNLLYQECGRSDRYTKEAIDCLLGYLFAVLLRIFDVGGNTSEFRYDVPLVGRAVSYVHLHFREDPSLSAVAERLCVTPNYLSERFHEATGKRYKEYLTEVKLRYARTLLETVGISVTEVCFASGFSSFSNFLRRFKDCYGCSPAVWRRLHCRK